MYLHMAREVEVEVQPTPIAPEAVEQGAMQVGQAPVQAVSLAEMTPQHVTVTGNTVRVEKDNLEFVIPEGFKVTRLSGSDDRTPPMVVIDLEKDGKEISVLVNYPGEFYGDIEEIELSVESEEKTAWQRPSVHHQAAGPFDVSWGNVRVVEDTSRYLTVMFKGYAPEDRTAFEALIDSLRYAP